MVLASGPLIRSYILEHPDLLPEAMQNLQNTELAKAVADNKTALEKPFGNAWAGAADGDVVLVEFFDYACPYCRKSNSDVARLLAEDEKLKIVWRDLPVLGEPSVAAAEASLSAAKQGKFHQFHDAMFETARPTPNAIAGARAAAGVTSPAGATASAPPEIRAEIQRNYDLASAVRATGTPLFVVGDKVLQGAVGYEALKQAVAEARAR
ncbi:MAG: thioredoxin domain-containing protein [Sphingosinicella sp.]|nr:thioredoxin domain-containing protein [Sphingosinicella sp.]